MTNLLLTLILLVNIIVLMSFFIIAYRVRAEYVRKMGDFYKFVSPASEGGTSPLADICNILSQQAGKTLAVEIKTALMGKESGVQRELNGLQGDMLADSNPLVGALMGQFPSLKRRLIKNPGLVELLLSHLPSSKIAGPGIESGDDGNGFAARAKY